MLNWVTNTNTKRGTNTGKKRYTNTNTDKNTDTNLWDPKLGPLAAK